MSASRNGGLLLRERESRNGRKGPTLRERGNEERREERKGNERGTDGDDLIGCCEIRTVSAQSCHMHMCSNAAVDGNLHWSSR